MIVIYPQGALRYPAAIAGETIWAWMGGPGVAVPGPYGYVAAQVYQPGAFIGQTYQPGQSTGQAYVPGAAIGEAQPT